MKDVPAEAQSNPFAAIGTAAPSRAAAAQLSLGEGSSGSSAVQLSLGPATANVPVAKLQLIQDNLQRAEHAMTAGLTSMVTAASKIQAERLIVQQTINTIANVTGVQPQHLA